MTITQDSELPKVVKFKTAIAELGISRSKADRLLKDRRSDFPLPFKIGAERYFRVGDLRDWIDRKAAAANVTRPSHCDRRQNRTLSHHPAISSNDIPY